jgi:DNA-binding MurR/RpiR family transcriptional regulator
MTARDWFAMDPEKLALIPRGCLIKVKSLYSMLKTAERKAADHLLDHPEGISELTIVDFAAAAGCSEATIVRLSKKLGYRGFPELKADFGANPVQEHHYDYRGIRSTDEPLTVVDKVFEANVQALKDTQGVLDMGEYRRALEALLGASRILFCGLGDAALVAMEAYQRFIRIGQSCMVSEDPDVQLIQAAHLGKGDVVMAFSHSGRSLTVVNTVKQARATGAVAIGVTNFPVSPLAKNADIVLQTAAFSARVTGEVVSKRVTQLCIVESLYINYMIAKGKSALKRLGASNEAVRLYKL